MTTTLEITCQGAVKVLPILHSICRIGSNPKLEICMPGIDDHSVTLRIQNGKRNVYNRSSKPVTLNGKQIQPEQTKEWQDNQVLELAEGIQLRLLGHRKESKSSVDALSVPANSDDTRKTIAPAVSDQRARRLTIVGFFIVFATILFSTGSDSAKRAAEQEFSKLIAALSTAEAQPNSGRFRQIRFEIQNAFLRHDRRDISVQNILNILSSAPTSSSAEIDAQVKHFIERYL